MIPNRLGISTFVDLFSGCGGFTLGMLRAGFHCLAAVDSNGAAIGTLRDNLQKRSPTKLPPVGFALQADVTKFTPAALHAILGTNRVDVIVGGPPCQGFSTARQCDGSNHGSARLKEDPRRHLFRNFLDFVEHFQPKVFVIENVLGLRSAAGGRFFTAVQFEARALGRAAGLPGYRVHAQIERGEELGAPQKRRRQLIIGVRADLEGYFPPELIKSPRVVLDAMLGDAILDLPALSAGEGRHETPYDEKRRDIQFFGGVRDRIRREFLGSVAEIGASKAIFNHVARPHSARDLRDFDRLNEGENAGVAARERGVEFEFPYSRKSFKDRYTRQHRNRPCSTIVAHLSKDGLMFIHPVQLRSFTPREAARVQTFPDWFVFPEARTHAFRLIGNAVPPLISEAVGRTIAAFMEHVDAPPSRATYRTADLVVAPADHAQAAEWLNPLMRADRPEIRSMDVQTFLRGWRALLWLFPDLHPLNALEHGAEQHSVPAPLPELSRRFARSGWPVVLEPLGREAWRRYQSDQLSDEDFYCVAAQRAGLNFQRTRQVAVTR